MHHSDFQYSHTAALSDDFVALRPAASAPKGRIISIQHLQPGQDRARRVVSRSNHRPTGKYPSWKMERHVQWESPNELNAYRLLDADPSVMRFQEQPLEIIYELDGVMHHHFPDTLVETQSGKALWEIKPRQWAMTPKNTMRAALMTSELPKYGYEYRLVIAEELRRQPRLNTVLTLLQWGRQDIPLVDRERLRLHFVNTPSVTWDAVLNGELGPDGRRYVSRLLLEGALSYDMDQPLTHESVLKLAVADESTHAVEV